MRNLNAKVSDPNEFVSNPGERFHVTFDPKVMPDGTIVLVESGREDVEEYINSFKDQTDMCYILKQLALGNTSVLSQKQPMYGDFTNMPTTYAEALQLVIDKEKEFYQLPLEVRNKFDNDYRQYIAQSGSDEWMTKMDSVIVKPAPDAEIQPIEKESKE